MNPRRPPSDLKIMTELRGQSPNDLLRMTIDKSKIGPKWKWELWKYINKKNVVDNRSLSWTKNGKKFWPLEEKGAKHEH